MSDTNGPESTNNAAGEAAQWYTRGESEIREIIKRRNHPVRRIGRFIRSYWYWGALLYVVVRASLDPEFLNLILVALGFAFQLVFAILFMIVQFGALFWFMSRTKVENIKPGDPKSLTFDDYKGQDHLLKLVKQWISLLSDRDKFQSMGGSFINGLLLYGQPGTGKTLLAKVMAGEAGVAFISIEGSGFRAMFWGVDVLRMIWFINKARKLARQYGSCIAYIDEIDAVGSSRGGVMGGRQGPAGMGMGGGMFGGGSGALTRLLYEMDGVGEQTRFEKIRARLYRLFRKTPPPRDWHVLFMGSTNRPDVLDPALTRPGRFDRVIEVGMPDRTGRMDIIGYYLGKIKHDDSVDVEAIVADTIGYTPAQIMSAITKDAVRLALFDGREHVTQRDIDLAFQEQAMGLENPIEDWEADQREQVAYHEAGHAVAVHHLMPEQRIVRATIIRRAGALGYVLPAEKFEIYSYPLKKIVRRIMVSLAGDVATKIHTGEAWTGTGSDFMQVRTSLWALAQQGFFGPPIADLSQPNDIIRVYKEEMTRFWQDSETRTERLLRDHWPEVEAIAQALLVESDLSGIRVREIIHRAANGHHPEPPTAVAVAGEPAAEGPLPTGDGADEAENAEGAASETIPEVQPASD